MKGPRSTQKHGAVSRGPSHLELPHWTCCLSLTRANSQTRKCDAQLPRFIHRKTYLPAGSRECVPQYLFRTVADESRGTNNHATMAPDTRNCRARIESIYNLTEMVEKHQKWKYEYPSEFVSWSSSLLFVLVHASRRRYRQRHHNVQVRILDVRKLASHMAIYPIKTMFQTLGIPHADPLWHHSYSQ